MSILSFSFDRTEKGRQRYTEFMHDLETAGYTITEPRTRSGYVSRKVFAIVSEYKGRYGTGYRIEYPNFETTGFHSIRYAIRYPNI